MLNTRGNNRIYSVADIKGLLQGGQIDKVYSLIYNDLSPNSWTDKIDLTGNIDGLKGTIEDAVFDAYRKSDSIGQEKINAIESFFHNASRYYPKKTIEDVIGSDIRVVAPAVVYSQPAVYDQPPVEAPAAFSDAERYEKPSRGIKDFYSGMKAYASDLKDNVIGATSKTRGYVVKGLATAAAALILALSPNIGNVDIAPRQAIASPATTAEQTSTKEYIKSLLKNCPTLFDGGESYSDRAIDKKVASSERPTAKVDIPFELSDGKKAFVAHKEDAFIGEIGRGEYFCLDPSKMTDDNKAWTDKFGPTGFVHSLLKEDARCKKDSYNDILWAMQGFDRGWGSGVYVKDSDRVRVMPGDFSVTAGQDGFLDDFNKSYSLEDIAGALRLPNSVKQYIDPQFIDETCNPVMAGSAPSEESDSEDAGIAADGWNEKYYGLRS